MTPIQITGLVLIAWGIATALVGLLKPASLWKMGKFQGFTQILGEKGATILFIVVGIAALIGGMLLLF